MLTELRRIFVAVLIRDMSTRFGASPWTYIIAIGWPLSHVVSIFCVYIFANSIAPIGDDPAIFVATGVAPYVLSLYPARWMSLTIAQNHPLLLFPVVRPILLIAARAALEMMSTLLVFALFFGGLWAAGYATWPHNIYIAAAAIALTVGFGVSMGLAHIVMVTFFRQGGVIFLVIIMLILYVGSGVFAPSIFSSSEYTQYLWFNPLYHCVGLLRSAYYDAYSTGQFTPYYVLYVIACLIFIGLVTERLTRGRILQG
jgi:capsular polysaccharide transport system permease protein